MISITVDGLAREATAGEHLIAVINRSGSKIPQVCYHPQLGPIQTSDTCMVEVDGCLVRACATTVSAGISVNTRFEAAWKVALPSSKGLDNHEMVDAIQQGKLKAMYLTGEEMSIVD